MQGNLFTGLNYLSEGFRLIIRPGIRPFVIIPLLINSVLFGGALWWGYSKVIELNDAFIGWLPGWLDWLSWILLPLFFVIAVLAIFYCFSLVANLIASPFNGYLAEKTEQLLTGEPLGIDNNWKKIVMLVPHSIGRELRKFAYYLPLLIGVLILMMIPGVNVIATPLWFILGAWMMSIQYLDYPLDNHELSFGEVKRGAQQQRLTSLGFGGVVMLGTMIPLVNLVIMPAAVCGATAYWVRELKTDFKGELINRQ